MPSISCTTSKLRILLFSVALVFNLTACGGTSDTSSPEVEDTASDDTATDTTQTDDATSDDTSDTGGTTDESDQAPLCDSWEITYDLTGSQFDIRNTPLGAGDTTADISEGTLILRVADEDGAPAAGDATLISYVYQIAFTVSEITTDVTSEAVAGECGVTTGTFAETTLGWDAEAKNHHTYGTVTCNAAEFICMLAGLPVGESQEQDGTHDQTLNAFEFSSDSLTTEPTSFEMDFVQIPNDEAGDTYLRLVGNEITRTCVVAPDCP